MGTHLRFGLVGCGRISKRHLELLAHGKIANAEVVATFGTEKKKAGTLAGNFGIRSYADGADIITNEDLDVISLFAPDML